MKKKFDQVSLLSTKSIKKSTSKTKSIKKSTSKTKSKISRARDKPSQKKKLRQFESKTDQENNYSDSPENKADNASSSRHKTFERKTNKKNKTRKLKKIKHVNFPAIVVRTFEECEKKKRKKEEWKYSVPHINELKIISGKTDKKLSDALAEIFEKDRTYLTGFSKIIIQQCIILQKLMDCIRYLGKSMKHIFEGFVEVATQKIAYISNVCQDDEMAIDEIKTFESLYRRLKRACHDFLEIHVGEYREHSKHQVNLCRHLIDEMDRIYGSHNVSKCIQCIDNFIVFLQKEDEKLLEKKGKLWDDKPRTRNKYLRDFKEKQDWIIRVIFEVLDEVKERYFNDNLSPKGATLNEHIEDLKKKCADAIVRKPKESVGMVELPEI